MARASALMARASFLRQQEISTSGASSQKMAKKWSFGMMRNAGTSPNFCTFGLVFPLSLGYFPHCLFHNLSDCLKILASVASCFFSSPARLKFEQLMALLQQQKTFMDEKLNAMNTRIDSLSSNGPPKWLILSLLSKLVHSLYYSPTTQVKHRIPHHLSIAHTAE